MIAGKWLRWLLNGFLKLFGDLKVFKWPMFIIYDPSSYQVKGADIRQVLKIAKPGDIFVRGYKNYLDGYFIPGYFSHAGLYLGEVLAAHEELIVHPKGKALFRTGEQIVVHAMAEGVFMEDLLDFCRCDYMALLRFPEQLSRQQNVQPTDIAADKFTPEELKIAAALAQGETLSFAEAFPAIFKVALNQIGKPYDFQFNFSNYNDLSCTEFVYFCTKSLAWYHGLHLAQKRFLLFAKKVLTPDALVKSNLRLAWQSRSVDNKKIEKFRHDRSA